MLKHYIPTILPMGALLLLAGCIDDNYDLSDIDTSVEVKINDLVIPVNLGTVTLNSVIDIEEGSSITKEPYQGSDPALQGKEIYVYNYRGTFNSNPIHINTFHVEAPEMEPAVVTLKSNSMLPARRNAAGLPTAISYQMQPMSTPFSYDIDEVDDKVATIDEITTPKVTFGTRLQLPEQLAQETAYTELTDVRLQFPKGLSLEIGTSAESTIGKYDAETGIVTIDNYKTSDSYIDLTVNAEVIDLDKAGVELKDGKFNYDGTIDVIGGTMDLTAKEGGFTDLPEELDIDIYYELSDFDVKDFTGQIDYDIEGLKFQNARLTDIPEFLQGDETRIRLANPQLYISIYNSCAPYKLGGITGLSVTPLRDNREGTPLTMDNYIRVGHDNGVGPYKFAISPEGSQLNTVDDYAGAEKLLFAQLGDVLYGNGLPDEVSVEFTDPHLDGTATNFPLREPGSAGNEGEIESIKGDYLFRAPLALADGSQIVYTDTRDDWDSEELEDLYVNTLGVSATATSTIPLDVTLKAYLLDELGNEIGVCESTTLPALAQGEPIEIFIRPEAGQEFITGINGIRYKAWAVSTAQGGPSDVPALSPEQTLVLDNIRIKVSGKYLKLDTDND